MPSPYKTSSIANGEPPRSLSYGVWPVSKTFTVTTALAVNDLIEMFEVPEGATALDWIFSSEDLDTNGTPTIVMDVGDDTVSGRFISGSTIGQGGGLERVTTHAGHAYKFPADTVVKIKVTTGPATGATGVSVTLTAFLTMDP